MGFFNRYLLIAVLVVFAIGAVALYISMHTVRELRAEVTTLHIQTQSLQTANDSLQADIRIIQKAQQEANRKLDAIRLSAAQATRDLVTRKFNSSNVSALTTQINKETADSFQRLEQLSHAP